MIRGTIRYKQLEGPKMEWAPAIVRARFIIALLFALVLFFNLTGCVAIRQESVNGTLASLVAGCIALGWAACLAIRGPLHTRALAGIVLTGLAVACFLVSGCAMLPQAMQPTEESSAYAEGTWLVLDAIDTAQTVQIAKHPQCFHEADPIAAHLYGGEHPNAARVVGTNIALAIVHTMVTSWLDTKVAEAQANDPDDVGPWYVGRVAWHTVSLLGTGGAVISNYGIGLKPLSAECNR